MHGYRGGRCDCQRIILLRAKIIELRDAGYPARVVAEDLGISLRTVHTYSNSSVAPYDEYADVVPIPFFPDDLPRLEKDPFWTPARLQWALSQRT
jgi:hypothetical protein